MPKVAWECPPHPKGLYRFDKIALRHDGTQPIGEELLAEYQAQGFLAFEDFYTPKEMERARAELTALVDGIKPGFEGVMIEASEKERFEQLSREERRDSVRKLFGFVGHNRWLKRFTRHSKTIATIERLMGRRPTLFQDMALLKPPRIGIEKPWHQDCAYFNYPLGTPVVGVWIALDEATAENGCMHVLPGSHREGPVIHWKRRDWQICDRDVRSDRDTLVPLKPGGVLFFSGMLHHGTPPNTSAQRRRAIQFHYRPVGVRKIDQEKRLAVFGSEGKNVEC